MEQNVPVEAIGHGSAYQPGEERRRSPRKKLQRPVVVTFATGEVVNGLTIEVSQGGVGVMLPKPTKVGVVCKLSFNLFFNGRRAVVAGAGKVMNCSCSGLDGFRTGMTFAISDPQAQELILEFLQ